MECKLTHVARPFRLNGGNGQMVNVTDGCCAATITTRYDGWAGLYDEHGQHTIVLIEYD